MKTLYHLLANAIIVGVANMFVWASVIYWVYLETRQVLATSLIGGMFLVITAVSGFAFGAIVDHNKKKIAMLFSSLVTLCLFAIGLLFYLVTPAERFTSLGYWELWTVVGILLLGVIVGNIRNIALPTLTALLIPEDRRDRANGLIGTATGIAFSLSNVAAGFVLAYAGMTGVLLAAVIATVVAIVHLVLIPIPEKAPKRTKANPARVDIKGTLAAVMAVPGLIALIFFTTFNNFLGGVFMSLMDAYGLSLVSVQVWGSLWGFLSLGFIVGGLIIARRGLGKNPVKTLLSINLVLWFICAVFTIQPSIVLLAAGLFLYLCLMPFIEASEHTVIQKVVPQERLGRVFGFAQSVEQAASPVSAFLIGPIAQFLFIPFMTTGRGVELIGDWFGVGAGRGIALVFVCVGLIGLVVTSLAMYSRPYRALSERYQKAPK